MNVMHAIVLFFLYAGRDFPCFSDAAPKQCCQSVNRGRRFLVPVRVSEVKVACPAMNYLFHDARFHHGAPLASCPRDFPAVQPPVGIGRALAIGLLGTILEFPAIHQSSLPPLVMFLLHAFTDPTCVHDGFDQRGK